MGLVLWCLEYIGDDNRYLVHTSSFEQSCEVGVVEKGGLLITGSVSLPLCITPRSEVLGGVFEDERLDSRVGSAVSNGVSERAVV